MSKNKPEYQKCIVVTSQTGTKSGVTWCANSSNDPWAFEGIDHAANSMLFGSRLTVCPNCIKAVVRAMERGESPLTESSLTEE